MRIDEQHNASGQLIAGLVLMSIGVLLLMDRMHVLSFSFAIRRYWPIFMIAAGVSQLLRRRSQ